MIMLKTLYKDYRRAGSNSAGVILESKEEKLQRIDDDWSYMGKEYVVYNFKTKEIVYKSHKYSDCVSILQVL